MSLVTIDEKVKEVKFEVDTDEKVRITHFKRKGIMHGLVFLLRL